MKKAICFILFLVSIFAYSGCGMVSEQPDKEELEQYLHENSDDFNTVLNYLIGQNGIVYFDYDGVEFENWFGKRFGQQQEVPMGIFTSLS